MRNYIIILIITFAFVECAYDYARYDNYQLYRLDVETEKQLAVVKAIEDYSDSYTVLEKTLDSVKVIVPPHKFGEFRNLLTEHAFQFVVLTENLQNAIDTEKQQTQQRILFDTKFNWLKYHRLSVIYEWMQELSETKPDIVTSIVVGRTYEGREIRGIKLSYKSGNPGVILESGIHAREWIGPATTTFFLNQLITSQDELVRLIAESYDWYLIPVANPDGYEYTHTVDRFWRKTRTPYFLVCYGADPNRNWDHHWGEQGASTNPCSDTYAGPTPFSEVETNTMSQYFKSIANKIQSYIAMHSYSQLILFAYGWTSQPAPNHNDLQQIGDKAAKALAKRYGTVYTVGNIYDTIYPVSGSSMEWAYDVLGAKISYSYELRPNNTLIPLIGFHLPENQIKPTGEETCDSLIALFSEAKSLGYR